jgi:hypothetical protein
MPSVRSSLLPVASVLSWKIARYSLTPACTTTTLTGPQRMKGNEQTIESLAHRVAALAELLRSPVSEDDVKERERRRILER